MSFEELDTEVVGPFGDNPSVSFAASSPFRGAICAVDYNIRCNKTMPPLKGEGDRRQAVERCAPRRQRCILQLLE